MYDDTTLNEIARKDRLTSLSLPLWEESEKIAKELTLLNIDSVQLVKSKYLYNYVLLRKEETALRIKMIDGEKGAEEKVVEVVKQIDELSGDLK